MHIVRAAVSQGPAYIRVSVADTATERGSSLPYRRGAARLTSWEMRVCTRNSRKPLLQLGGSVAGTLGVVWCDCPPSSYELRCGGCRRASLRGQHPLVARSKTVGKQPLLVAGQLYDACSTD
ncbi:hypothetical protein MRX96_035633 [Rhipicephalus microplus]